MSFRTTVELAGRTATGFEVPAGIVEALGSGRRPAVTVTVNGYSYRSTVAVMGGRYLLPLSAEHRQGAGVAAGDEVEVTLELDTAPREVAVPGDLAEALDRAPEAKAFFDGLSYSRRRRVVLQVEGAKKAETRQRRVADAITKLAAGEA
ncbi:MULTISPECIES: YdeI/OmpD-associated family protein [Nonomuraea]|uniref:YdeI/OmpD-associated family protein n=1 Tax=Nonomuraea TaxID=83681 RepID=UPI001C5FE33B|nr:YdeI/OmpD-associated family protein [Nonomuraea ceibae]